jgi:phosphotransacetylase
MLQEINKPVNDLSPSALVENIVYTIALTAKVKLNANFHYFLSFC